VCRQQKQEAVAKEGWEYAAPFTTQFHATERTVDIIRRRRWHRKMVGDDKSGAQMSSSACNFRIPSKKARTSAQ